MDELWRVFEGEISRVLMECCDMQKRKVSVQGTAWWNRDMKRAVREKKKTYLDCLNSKENRELEREKWRIYKEKKIEAKSVVKEKAKT